MNNNFERYVGSNNPQQDKVYYPQNQNNNQNPFNVINNNVNQIAGIGAVNHQVQEQEVYPKNNNNQNYGRYEDEDYSGLITSAGSKVRGKFIAKVYAIMSFQILITFLMILAAYKYQSFRNLIIDVEAMRYTAFSWICFVFAIIIEIAIFCCRSVSRKVPLNYLLLFIFTFCFGTLVAAPCIICFQYLSNGVQLVILAGAITLGVTLLLTAYAWHTKEDYTMMGHFCFTLSITLLILCIVGIFIHNIWFQLFICCLSVIVYSGYIIVDTQLIVGNQSHCLSVDDYIIAAMLLYIDLVILFLRILEILMILFGKN